MAIRTIEIYGMGFGTTPAEVTVTANGNQVFSGTVPTVNQPLPALPNPDLIADQVILFTFETDTNFTGLLPMTCQVTNGTIIFGAAKANYVAIPNPVFTQMQYDTLLNPASTWTEKMAIYSALANPPFSAEDLTVLNDKNADYGLKIQIFKDHNVNNTVSSGINTSRYIYDVAQGNFDPRTNVTLDGVSQIINRGDLLGIWWWPVINGSTLGYDLEVPTAVM
jgi:hypothetical protein